MLKNSYPTIRINKGREKSILRRHPWVYASAVENEPKDIESGEMVKVFSSECEFLAYGAFSPKSQIRVRLWSWDIDEEPSRDFVSKKLKEAFELRESFIDTKSTTAYRLVHAESDGLPGMVIDRYNDYCVIQFLSAGTERMRDDICEMVIELLGNISLYERSDVNVRKLEGLPLKTGILKGEEPQKPLVIFENGLRFTVDIVNGQKTGFYIDQRYNRMKVRELARDKSVLNCFAYTGAFSIYALDGKAKEVTSIESSSNAIALGRNHIKLNNFHEASVTWIEGDVFEVLREFRDRGKQFDMIVLDPPKFAHNVAQAERAARAYKDINLLAFKLLNRGGYLITFSCSGSITPELFQKVVADAALDAHVNARILSRLTQGPDHPVGSNFPEGEYLKGLSLVIS